MKHELQRLEEKLHPESGDGTWRPDLQPPNDPIDVLAHLLWKILGHPDKRLRWRGAHAVRRLARLGRVELLDRLISC